MKNILLVEDEKQIREIERDYLKKEGFNVVEAVDGQDALHLFRSGAYDLIILDLNLPVLDGITVCKRIRKESQVPIIMVTARSSEVDEIMGLDIGADDYVTKPFSPKILLARVKALLKRPTAIGITNQIKAGDIVLDLTKQKLYKKDQQIELTATQFNILTFLMKNQGKVFSRDTLITKGYDKIIPPDVFDRTIDSHIKNIRHKIEDDSKNPKYIKTVRGKGYTFAEQEA